MRKSMSYRCSAPRSEDKYRDYGSGSLRRLQILCIAACPYNVRFINSQTKVADNCNFCLDTRLSKGLEPACVNACRHGALYFGDLNDPQSIISRLLRVKDTVRIRAHLGTDPNLRYVPVTETRSLIMLDFTIGLSEGVAWPWPIAVYLFLAGISGGAVAIAICLNLFRGTHLNTPIMKAASLIGFYYDRSRYDLSCP